VPLAHSTATVQQQNSKTLLQLRIAQKTRHNKHHLNPMNYSDFHLGRMRFSLVLSVTRCRLVVSYRHFGTAYWSHLQGSSSPRRLDFLDYKGDDPRDLRWIALCLISSTTFCFDFILTAIFPSHLVLNMQVLLVWESLFVESQNAPHYSRFVKHCCIQYISYCTTKFRRRSLLVITNNSVGWDSSVDITTRTGRSEDRIPVG